MPNRPFRNAARLAAATLSFLAVLLIAGAAAPADDGPALARGVSLSHWFEHGGRSRIWPQDMVLIREAGFDHVRIQFNPAKLGWKPVGADPEMPLPDVARLDEAVRWANEAGLVAIVDFHPSEEDRETIETLRTAERGFVDLWRFLARRYAAIPPDRVVFELMNEPQYYGTGGPARWNRLLRELVAALRPIVPEHTLLLAAPYGSSIDGLAELAPVDDRKVRYVFHFYEPYLMTHLAANWEPFTTGGYRNVRNLPYPADAVAPSAVEITPGIGAAKGRERLDRYLSEGWDAARIATRIGEASEWAAARGVRLVCTEFGLTRVAPRSDGSRERWLADVRRALESYGIGWTVFDYTDMFAVAVASGDIEIHEDGTTVLKDPARGRRAFEPAALDALGMR